MRRTISTCATPSSRQSTWNSINNNSISTRDGRSICSCSSNGSNNDNCNTFCVESNE